MVIDIMLILIISICFYTDLRFKKIYNCLIFPGIIVALSYHFLVDGPVGIWFSIKGLLLGIGLLFFPFALGGIGAGDVKLLGFIGACSGPGFVWLTFLATALAGGLLAILILIKNKKLLSGLKVVWYTILSLFGATPRVNMLGTLEAENTTAFPYGVAITTGTVVAYLMR